MLELGKFKDGWPLRSLRKSIRVSCSSTSYRSMQDVIFYNTVYPHPKVVVEVNFALGLIYWKLP